MNIADFATHPLIHSCLDARLICKAQKTLFAEERRKAVSFLMQNASIFHYRRTTFQKAVMILDQFYAAISVSDPFSSSFPFLSEFLIKYLQSKFATYLVHSNEPVLPSLSASLSLSSSSSSCHSSFSKAPSSSFWTGLYKVMAIIALDVAGMFHEIYPAERHLYKMDDEEKLALTTQFAFDFDVDLKKLCLVLCEALDFDFCFYTPYDALFILLKQLDNPGLYALPFIRSCFGLLDVVLYFEHFLAFEADVVAASIIDLVHETLHSASSALSSSSSALSSSSSSSPSSSFSFANSIPSLCQHISNPECMELLRPFLANEKLLQHPFVVIGQFDKGLHIYDEHVFERQTYTIPLFENELPFLHKNEKEKENEKKNDGEEEMQIEQGEGNVQNVQNVQNGRKKRIDDFYMLERLGQGTHGSIHKVIPKSDRNKTLVFKKMFCEELVLNSSILRELSLLKRLKHPYIIEQFDCFVLKQDELSERCTAVGVLEYLPLTLQKWRTDNLNPYSLSRHSKQILKWMKQLLEALVYLHARGIVHRDIKLTNLMLVDKEQEIEGEQKEKEKETILKLIDFGLARYWSQPGTMYTPDTCTCGYKAPEVLLGTKSPNTAIDIWAFGCVFAILLHKRRALHGPFYKDEQSFELYHILQSLGTPDAATWPDLHLINRATKFNSVCSYIPVYGRQPWSTILERPLIHLLEFSPHTCSFLDEVFTYDPQKRPSAAQLLQHPIFLQCV